MIRATIVLLIAHAVIPRLRRASAAERHLLWVAAMATAAMLPGVALIMPAWRPIWATTLMDALPASLATLSWALPRSPDVVLRATRRRVDCMDDSPLARRHLDRGISDGAVTACRRGEVTPADGNVMRSHRRACSTSVA